MASEVLESAGAPLTKSCEINDKNFDTLYPDGEMSQILFIPTPWIDYAPNLITTL